jgi:hypothetical protein
MPLQAFMPLQAWWSTGWSSLAHPERTTAPPISPAAAADTTFPKSRRLIGFFMLPPKDVHPVYG